MSRAKKAFIPRCSFCRGKLCPSRGLVGNVNDTAAICRSCARTALDHLTATETAAAALH